MYMQAVKGLFILNGFMSWEARIRSLFLTK